MKKLALALALALAISPLTFAKKADTSAKMHKKGKHTSRTQWRRGTDGTSLYRL